MDIQARKLSFIQEFLRLSDLDSINKLERLLHSERKKLLDACLSPMSDEEYQKMIDNSEADIKNGRYVDANEVLKRFNT